MSPEVTSPSATASRVVWAWLAWLLVAGCGGGVLGKDYEYEEELYPALDGSGTLYVSSSVPALVALRGVDLSLDAAVAPDRDRVRALFTAPGVEVRRPTVSRRSGRRFVHVRIDVADLRTLSTIAPLAWSQYQLARRNERLVFRQLVGAAVGKSVGEVGWNGTEIVAFRLHVPSRIEFHNSRGPIGRGNILAWEQPLSERLRGMPVELEVRMERESILAHTLLLFGGSILAAAAVFGLAIWLIARKGRTAAVPGV